MEILNQLNPQQKKAVQHNQGPLLILAGAGSGKTRVLTHRIAYLINYYDVPPQNILTVTFTNKAADEMKERAQKLLGAEKPLAWMGTFHSVCVQILRREAGKLGYEANFSIFDATDQRSLVKEVLQELDFDVRQYKNSVMRAINSAKNNLVGPDDYAVDSYLDKIVAQVYPEYQEQLAANNAFDFGDLIMKTVELLTEHSLVLDYYQDQFKYILVDEYQDVNQAQYKLLNLLAEKYNNICVVGDDDQGIYGFRGADISNILSFEEDYPDTKVVKLEQNYRSTQKILDAAYQVVSHNLRRKEKKLWTDNPPGEDIKLYQARSGKDEGRYIAKEIKRLQQEAGYSLDDCAVLYRTNAQARILENTLLKQNINYRIVGGVKFYERKEIKDILAYLRLAYNPDDDISLARVINVPSRGVGPATRERLSNYADQENISLIEAVKQVDKIADISTRFANNVRQFKDIIDYLQQQKAETSVFNLTKELIEKIDYFAELRNKYSSDKADDRINNVKELLTQMEEFKEENPDGGLTEFLEEIALLSDVDQLEEDQEAVVLMTLHSAKGLEFPVVFLAGMEEELLPHGRSLDDEEGVEEERRLCYVGMTRAEEKLYLTYSQRRKIYGQTQFKEKSRFIGDLAPDLLVDAEQEPVIASSNSDSSTFNDGEKVEHPHWGVGTVISTDTSGDLERVQVSFPNEGIKELAVEYGDLKKV